MTILKLEELNVWQKARELAKDVYALISFFPKEEKYNIVKHLKECSRNVPGNIAEGFGRFHYQESIQFYRIARGSLNEIKSDLYFSFDQKYLEEDKFKELIEKVEVISKMLNSLISSTSKLKTNSK